MNSIPLWIINPPQPPFNARSRLQGPQTRSEALKSKWFRSTSYNTEKSLSKQQAKLNKMIQSIMVTATNTLVSNYKEIISDLEEAPSIRMKVIEDSPQKVRHSLIESNMDKIIKHNICKNAVIQKQHQNYHQMYRLVTESNSTNRQKQKQKQKQKQQSLFIKSVSTHIQSSSKIQSRKASSRLFKTMKPPQIINGKDKIFYSVHSKYNNNHNPQESDTTDFSNKHRPINSSNDYSNKVKIFTFEQKDKIADYRTNIHNNIQNNNNANKGPYFNNPNNKQLKSINHHEETMFKNRRTKQYPSKVLESRKMELDLQEEGLIKLIQNKIQNNYFGIVLTNKSVYKKKMRTFYKG